MLPLLLAVRLVATEVPPSTQHFRNWFCTISGPRCHLCHSFVSKISAQTRRSNTRHAPPSATARRTRRTPLACSPDSRRRKLATSNDGISAHRGGGRLSCTRKCLMFCTGTQPREASDAHRTHAPGTMRTETSSSFSRSWTLTPHLVITSVRSRGGPAAPPTCDSARARSTMGYDHVHANSNMLRIQIHILVTQAKWGARPVHTFARQFHRRHGHDTELRRRLTYTQLVPEAVRLVARLLVPQIALCQQRQRLRLPPPPPTNKDHAVDETSRHTN